MFSPPTVTIWVITHPFLGLLVGMVQLIYPAPQTAPPTFSTDVRHVAGCSDILDLVGDAIKAELSGSFIGRE